MMNKLFVEIGFDLDNNRLGFGRSVEIEYFNGSEKRGKHVSDFTQKLSNTQSYYLRVWVGRTVFIFDTQTPHVSTKKKERLNFKVVFGKWRYCQ